MSKIKFWIFEVVFFFLPFIIFIPVVDKTRDIVLKNTPVYEMVSESIKLYTTETVIGKGIVIFAFLAVLYYIIVRRIGILFVYSWINAVGLCGIAQSWLSYDYAFGGSIVGALVVAIVITAYTIVTVIFVLIIIIKFCCEKFSNKKQKSGE
ncbi:MAG: hypothetical protein IKA10_03590 [Oscillospiraceae bacterium]|nr:hypothetical protein [Oscillospiraceae bacterium]